MAIDDEERRLRKNAGMKAWRERMKIENPERLRRDRREWKRADYAKHPEKHRARQKVWADKNREKVRARSRVWYALKGKDFYKKWGYDDRRKNPARYMLNNCMNRAKKIGVPFDLTYEDIVVPDVCPVLGIKLMISSRGFNDCSPSVDRMEPKRGYVRGNVSIISWRANALKRDGTLDEFRRLVSYMEREIA